MSSLFLLFSHSLTPEQEREARTDLCIRNIIQPPEEIQAVWSKIPPENEELSSVIQPVQAWLDQYARQEDFVLIQGEFGACFLLVKHALQKGYIPIYSTTRRQAIEKKLHDGKIVLTHLFRHVRFRRYNI